MNAGRTVRMTGIAVSLSAAIAIGMVTGSESLRASASQDTQPRASLKPVIYKSLKHDVSPRLDSIQPIEPVAQDLNRVRINRFLPSRLKMAKQLAQIGQDPVAQLAPGLGLMPSPVANFEGVPNVSGVLPPDTQGDVGPDHYVQWVNLAFAIYDKTGTKVYPVGSGFANGNTLWTGFGGECETTNDGDPITLYDHQAGRWLMTQFAVSGVYTQCIAVSQTSDPTGAWYRYAYAPFGNKMNDYPKFGVWPDGYYMTINQFTDGVSWGGAGVVAFERDKMLAGLAAQAVYFDLYARDPNLGGMLPSDLDGGTPPPAGSPNYILQFDDDGAGYPADQLELFKFHVDWTNVANSTFAGPTVINLTALGYGFDSNMCGGLRNCIPQPGPTTQRLDAISDRLMYRLAYRNFGDHESLVVNHTVDVDGADHAGIRWYELRDPNGTPAIHQAGTYAPDADHRWMGSIAMDGAGNIALGYSVSSQTTYPSVRYAGRLAGDPLGTLEQAEVTLMAGTGSQTHTSARWGDYSMMGIDPTDDCTFWYTQQYIQTTASALWQTRIGSFKFPTCTSDPSGRVTGLVTDSVSGLPIQGVKVQLGTLLETRTAADGTYQFLSVPVGTYDLIFSTLGYVSQTFNGVSVASGLTTTQNVALVAAAPAIISGVVRDGSGHIWPLYARIDVTGLPSKTVYTDPATGQYSISLWADATYQLTATALVPGYLTGSASVTPAGDPAAATVDFDLLINATTCTAPGYSNSTGAYYSVDFEVNNGSFVGAGTSSSWAWGTPTTGPGSAHSGTKVWATNLAGNYNTNENSTLTSPLIDLSAFSGQVPTISWWQWLQTEPTWDTARFEVSKNGGSTWTTVYGPVTGTIDSAWTKRTVTLDSSYAVSGFRMRFHLIADFIYNYPGWYVDDVSVAIGCNAVAGGMVVGAVSDANTGEGLVGATVTSVAYPTETTTSVATPNDPNVPDGFYQLFSSATGTVAFDGVKAGGYATQRTNVPVVANDVVTQDFQLAAGRVSALPASLTVDVTLGATTTRQFTLSNDGGVAATYQVKEILTAAPQRRPEDGASQAVAALAPQLPPQKAYYDAPSTAGLVVGDQPVALPLAAGDVIQSWSSGLTGPWGIAFDSVNNTIWDSSPVAAWGGENKLAEYSRAGVATGRSYSYTWAPANGPADGAFNWNTGKIFVMNIQTGVANCIFEIDPATGPTSNKICPGGATGFPVSQRGVAYDPVTDTWYAGGWNDLTIYRFSSSGSILDSKLVGLAIAGLAYNPDTHHLFVMVNASPTAIYVLDTSDNYSVVGQFSIAGFGNLAGGGLEIGCNGHLWANNLLDGQTYEIDSGETTTVCTTDFQWLSVNPSSGTLTPTSSQVITVTFDARASAGITQTGQYTAHLAVQEDTPYIVPEIPVTMNVTPSCTFTIDPISAALPAAGGPGSVAVTASAPDCGWTAVSNDAWITVDPGTASGTGNGTVNYTVAANPLSTSRAGTVTIGGQTFAVTQAGALVITGLTANVTFPVTTGTPMTWTATATGGVAPLQYQFIRYSYATGVYSVVQAYSTTNTYVWTPGPAEAGQYYLTVWVRNAGSVTPYDATRNGTPTPFVVAAAAVPAITALTANVTFPVTTGTPMTWTATATGGVAPLQYQFIRYSYATGVYLVVQAYSTTNTYAWTPGPAEAGQYYLTVWVRNAGSVAPYDATRNGTPTPFIVAAAAPAITGLTANVTFPVTTGTPMTWTATATGGVAPLQYQFIRYSYATGVYSVVQAYSTTNTYAWTPGPAEAGQYYLTVWVRNAGSLTPYDATRNGTPTPFIVAAAAVPVITALTANVTFPVTTGTPMTWTATATGGVAPLQYQFIRYSYATGVYLVVQAYSTTNTYAWTPGPAEAGQYYLTVWVRNAGSVAPYDATRNGTPAPFTITP